MVNFKKEQRVKMVEFYFQSGRSIILVQKTYGDHFNVRNWPSVIRKLMQRFEETGSLINQEKKELWLSQTSLRRILTDLKMFPYKIKLVLDSHPRICQRKQWIYSSIYPCTKRENFGFFHVSARNAPSGVVTCWALLLRNWRWSCIDS